ncbi:hypothetical protein diail_9124 [Diaporthe ilicicola]|nr:hypothetical protein diail_9124 [Diaporthe ilicicola]
MVKRYRHVSHMTREDISLLVRLLCLPPSARRYTDGLPSEQWLARQAEKISQLPKPLQRPQDWLARLSMYTNKKLDLSIEDLVPQCAVLCAAHKGLNPWVVHRVFLLISEEVTHRLDPVRKFLENPTKHAVKLKTSLGEVQDYVDRMNSMLSLWTGSDVFTRIVGDNYPPGLAMPRVDNDCEACICSCVGAAGQALCDLRAMMYGRSHRRRPPVLIPLVEAWLDRFGKDNAERLLAESTRMARDVRHIRKRLLRHKSGHRRHRTPYEKRMKERARLERGLDEQRLSASQVRSARGEIDKKLDDMFGKESRKPDGHQGKHPSSASSNASSATTRPKSTCNDHSVPVNDNLSVDPRSRTSWDDADDAEPLLADYHDEFDEADADAAYKQQDRLQGWYDNFTEIVGTSGATDIGSQHPAFRQNAAGIESTWARSQTAISALPNPLHFSKNVTCEEDDDDDNDFVPVDGTQVSEWTDVSVHTLATQSTHKSRGSGRPRNDIAPPVPRIPSAYRDKPATRGEDHRDNAVHSIYTPSSVYSEDAATAAHPRPAATISFVPRSPAQAAASSRTNRSQPSMGRVGRSAVTAWPGPNRSSRHRRAPSSSSNTTLSSREFQAGLNSINDDGLAGASLPTASILPEDSISVVGQLYSADRPDQHRWRQDQIDADAALARQMQDESDSDDGDSEDGEDGEDVRSAIEYSLQTAKDDEERRSRAGRGGRFSGLYMPDSSWI